MFFQRKHLSFAALLALFALIQPTQGADTRDLARAFVEALPSHQAEKVTADELAKVKLWMAIPFDRLPLASEIGLKNLFETGQSQGGKHFQVRNAIESNALDHLLSIEPSDLHPKYTYLFHEDLLPIQMGTGYGDVFLEFSEKVYDRTTFGYGDSLATGGSPESLQKNSVKLDRLQSAYNSTLGYGEAQIWGKTTLEDVSNIIYPADFSNEKIETLRKISNSHGITLKSYDPNLRKTFNTRNTQTTYVPKRTSGSKKGKNLQELERLYFQQENAGAKSGVLDEIGKLVVDEDSKNRVLDRIKKAESGNAHSDFIARIELQKNRLSRIRNALIQIAESSSTPDVVATAKTLASELPTHLRAGLDPIFLFWKSKSVRHWSPAERKAAKSAFLNPDWTSIGLLDESPETLGKFVRAFDAALPQWWEDEKIFTKFLNHAQYDLSRYTNSLVEKLRTTDEALRLRTFRAIKNYQNELARRFPGGNATTRELSDFLDTIRDAFPNDCSLLLTSSRR